MLLACVVGGVARKSYEEMALVQLPVKDNVFVLYTYELVFHFFQCFPVVAKGRPSNETFSRILLVTDSTLCIFNHRKPFSSQSG